MEIAILIYNGFTALDVVGPYEILSRFPGVTVKFAAKEKGVVESEYKFLKMTADYSIQEISRADILLVPGSTAAFMQVAKDKEVVNWISAIHSTTRWTTAVCSGTVILAATGLLNGLEVTSHWGVYDQLRKLNTNPVAERFVQNGKIITAAGVSAGIDMALNLAALEQGEEFAQMLQLVIEYDPKPKFDTGSLAKAPQHIIDIAREFLMRDIQKMTGGTI